MARNSARFARQFCAARPVKSNSRRRSRLLVQTLEDRTTPATFIVTSAADSGTGTLRDAIANANATVGPDTIVFDTGGTFATPQVISLQTPLPTITDNLTINGTGTSNLTVRRDPAATNFRVFTVTAPNITLSGFTVTNGVAVSDIGGGLRSSGNVTLDTMVFTGNQATGTTGFGTGGGGAIGIDVGSGLLKVVDSTISGNTAAKDGGGIFFYYSQYGSLLVQNSTISGNSQTFTGTYQGFFGGGGIFLAGYPSPNPPPGFTPGSFTISNSTIANNSATGSGGGIFAKQVYGGILVQDSTISGNTAITTGSFPGQYETYYYGGGGIGTSFGVPTLTVQNSVVSGNVNTGGDPDIQTVGTTNVYYSAIGSSSGFTISNGDHNLDFGTDLKLGPLADNGGPTQTMAPAADSPLIDAGADLRIPANTPWDQRGFGFRRSFNGTVDIGAFEVQPLGLPFALSDPTPLTTPGGSTYSFTVTYWDPTGTNNGIKFSSVVTPGSIIVTDPNGDPVPVNLINVSPIGDATPLVATYQINAPGGTWDGSNDGVYTVQVAANQVQDKDGNFVPPDFLGPIDIFVPRTLTVTSTADSGPGSLRDVLTDAESIGSDDTVVFDPAVFGTTPQVINLESTLPVSTPEGGNLTILGPGPGLLTVQRDPAAPSFTVLASSTPVLELSGFTVSGGVAENSVGGGLIAVGEVLLDNMVFSGNSATGTGAFGIGSGGAIALVSSDSFLDVRDTTITGNTADQNGAGIYFFNGGSLVLENSTISGNTTTGATSAYAHGGAAVYMFGTPNAYPPAGFVPNTLLVVNSTIVGNTSASFGGGFAMNRFAGTLTILSSTIVNNASTGTGGADGGGGIALVDGGGTIQLANSIVSGNTAAGAGGGPDIRSSFAVYAYSSAFGDMSGASIVGANNITGDPATLGLGPLQDNGGPTQTMAPLVGGMLLDAGDPTFIPPGVTTDQRGLDRVDPETGLVDIGAVEAQPATVTIAPAAGQANPTNNNSAVTFTVVFDQPVTGFDASGISLAGSTVGGTLSVDVAADSPTTYTVTVTGITSDGDVVATVNAGTATVGVNASGQANLPSTPVTVTVDTTSPTVTVHPATGQNNPTNASPLNFAIDFSEPVIGFDLSDVTVTSSIGDNLLPVLTPVAGTNDYLLTVFGVTNTSRVTVSVAAGAATDLAGNPSLASNSTGNSIDYDITPPSVTISRSAGEAATVGGTSVTFDGQFSEPVQHPGGGAFNGSDVSVSDGLGDSLTVRVDPGAGPNSYVVTVSGMTGSTTVTASVHAGVIQDLAGNDNLASPGPDPTVTFVHSGSIHFSADTYSVTEQGGGQLTITVQRTGGSDGPLDVHYATADGTATAGTDYTAVSGDFHWDAGDASDRTFVVPILDDGGSEPDSAFTVNLSNISLAGALGTPTATVNIDEEAAIGFTSTTFTTAESQDGGTTPGPDVHKLITVSRQGGSSLPVSVNYTVTAGTATAGADYSALSSGTLSWAAGDTADKTIDITIHDDLFSEGKETINLALSSPSANVILGTAAATLTILPSDGITIQATAKSPVASVTDADGDVATIKLGGKVGSLTYYLTNDAGPISEIDLTGTDPTKSTLSITVKKPRGGTGFGTTTVGEVDGIGTAGLKSLSMAKADLVGAGINFNGFVGSVVVGNVLNGADILLNGTATTPRGAPLATRITAAQIEGSTATGLTDISVAAPLASLKAVRIGQGTITAPSVGSITVTGKAKTKTAPAIPGDLQSDVTVAGTGLASTKVPALRALRVAGTVQGSTITVGGGAGTNGNVGSVSVGAFVDSLLFAGYSGPADGSGSFNLPATVGSFVVRPPTKAAPNNEFAGSHVIAANFNAVSLGTVDPTVTGTKFGFVYQTKLKALTVKTPKFKFDPKGPAVQDLAGTDFEVKKV